MATIMTGLEIIRFGQVGLDPILGLDEEEKETSNLTLRSQLQQKCRNVLLRVMDKIFFCCYTRRLHFPPDG